MKTFVLLSLLFICALPSVVSAQGISAGIKAGTDLHKVTGRSFDEEYKFGYHIGGFVELKYKRVGIQPELYFSQANTKMGNDSTSLFNVNHIKEAKLSYLNIPVMLNLKFSSIIALQAGPVYSVLLNKSNSLVTNGKNAFKNGDFSLAGGLEIRILKFRVYGRYLVGLNNLNDIESKEKWKSQTAHIGVAYSLL